MTGMRLRVLRTNADLNMSELGGIIGVNRQQIYRWESKKGEHAAIPPKHWARLALELGCSVEEFIPPAGMNMLATPKMRAKIKEVGNQTATNVVTASSGSTAISAGRDVQNATNHEDIYLTPKERYLFMMLREYGSEKLLDKFTKILIDMKAMTD